MSGCGWGGNGKVSAARRRPAELRACNNVCAWVWSWVGGEDVRGASGSRWPGVPPTAQPYPLLPPGRAGSARESVFCILIVGACARVWGRVPSGSCRALRAGWTPGFFSSDATIDECAC